MKPEPGAPAREKVLFQLKLRGPQSAARIAERLGVTPVAVRQHLYRLAEDGLVHYVDERRKVGRPLRVWQLTDAARARFPDTHADLTLDLLGAVRRVFGDDGLDRLISQRTREQERHYRDRMPPRSAPLDARVAALASIRRDEGYMAEVSRRSDGGFLLIENHCPICAAAKACTNLCRDELALFRRLLGRGVTVERVEHLLHGARRCAYRIKPRAARETGASAQSGRP